MGIGIGPIFRVYLSLFQTFTVGLAIKTYGTITAQVCSSPLVANLSSLANGTSNELSFDFGLTLTGQIFIPELAFTWPAGALGLPPFVVKPLQFLTKDIVWPLIIPIPIPTLVLFKLKGQSCGGGLWDSSANYSAFVLNMDPTTGFAPTPSSSTPAGSSRRRLDATSGGTTNYTFAPPCGNSTNCSFSWVQDAQTPCNVDCGVGYSVIKHICRSNETGLAAAETMCVNVRPTDVVPCERNCSALADAYMGGGVFNASRFSTLAPASSIAIGLKISTSVTTTFAFQMVPPFDGVSVELYNDIFAGETVVGRSMSLSIGLQAPTMPAPKYEPFISWGRANESVALTVSEDGIGPSDVITAPVTATPIAGGIAGGGGNTSDIIVKFTRFFTLEDSYPGTFQFDADGSLYLRFIPNLLAVGLTINAAPPTSGSSLVDANTSAVNLFASWSDNGWPTPQSAQLVGVSNFSSTTFPPGTATYLVLDGGDFIANRELFLLLLVTGTPASKVSISATVHLKVPIGVEHSDQTNGGELAYYRVDVAQSAHALVLRKTATAGLSTMYVSRSPFLERPFRATGTNTSSSSTSAQGPYFSCPSCQWVVAGNDVTNAITILSTDAHWGA